MHPIKAPGPKELSSLLQAVRHKKLMIGVKVYRRVIDITHLFLANEILLFFQVTSSQNKKLK